MSFSQIDDAYLSCIISLLDSVQRYKLTVAFMACKYDEAVRVSQQLPITDRYRFHQHDREITYYIYSDWFCALGHIALLDYLYKARVLDLLPKCSFVYRSSDIPKMYHSVAISFLTKLNAIDLDKEKDCYPLHSIERLSFWIWPLVEKDGVSARNYIYTEALIVIERHYRAWTTSFSIKSRLEINKDSSNVAAARLCCLHIRESDYHSWNLNGRTSYRDMSFDSVLPILSKLKAYNYQPMRIGNEPMTTQFAGLHDITTEHPKEKRLDATLRTIKSSSIYIGCNSGIGTFTSVYNIPALWINWVPIGLPYWDLNGLLIFKRLLDLERQHYTSLNQFFSIPDISYAQLSDNSLCGYELVENSYDEISNACEDFLKYNEYKQESKCKGLRLDPETYGFLYGSEAVARLLIFNEIYWDNFGRKYEGTLIAPSFLNAVLS